MINHNSKKRTSATADVSKFKIKSSGDCGFFFNSFHSLRANKAATFSEIDQFAHMRYHVLNISQDYEG